VIRIEGADEASTGGPGEQRRELCSSKVQQRHCADPSTVNPHTSADLRHRPPVTALPRDGKEMFLASMGQRAVKEAGVIRVTRLSGPTAREAEEQVAEYVEEEVARYDGRNHQG
jgi:hypothetical protein